MCQERGFMQLEMPLVTYVGALAVLSFCLLWLFNRDKFYFEPLITALSGAITLLAALMHEAIDYWLSVLLVAVFFVVIASMLYQEKAFAVKWNFWAVIAFFGSGTYLLFWNDYEHNIRGNCSTHPLISKYLIHNDSFGRYAAAQRVFRGNDGFL
jgi:hypothetical protein